MEVVDAPIQQFHFKSTTTTPYMSAPSSPNHFDDGEFAFAFSGQLEKNAPPPVLASADELFDQGKIRPLPLTTTINRGTNSTPIPLPQLMTPISPHATISCTCNGSWKWRIKNFLLFRSLSEGRLARAKKEGGGDGSRSTSFRSVDSNGSVRRGRHYAANKVAEEGTKRGTALPCRPSFFSCLSFSPALHGLASRGW